MEIFGFFRKSKKVFLFRMRMDGVLPRSHENQKK